MRSARAVLVLCSLMACGTSRESKGSAAPDEDGGIAGGVACVDTDNTGPSAVCDTSEDGGPCGARGECAAGECIFPAANTPCGFDFSTAPANAYLVIACEHDLGGEEVRLNAGITLEYNGGSIRNGKLRLNGGHISGELLNPKLELGLRNGGGSLINPIFVLNNERWKMHLGAATDETALSNRVSLKMAIDQVGELGGSTFVLGALDVFLDVATGPYEERSLFLPSNFHLEMCNETHLRVYPNAAWEYSILSSAQATNVHISGGHLWGDRYTHDYEGGGENPQDQGLGIYILGGVDVVIEGLSANQFIGDGLVVGLVSRRNDDGSPKEGIQYSANVTVRNCVFDENRRNGLALIDVEGALLENLTISNTALGDPAIDGRSAGTSPRQGIDIEPYQPLLGDGSDTLRILEEVTDVVIRNSTFSGNFAGDINFFKCHRAEAYGNTFGSSVGMVASYEVSVHDNIFMADRERPRAIHVKAVVRDNGEHFVRDWEIYNNRISGYEKGISVGGENHVVYNNTIDDFETGIYLLSGVNNRFEGNVMASTRGGSVGYRNFRRIASTGTISGGSVVVDGSPFTVNELNQELVDDSELRVENVEFTSASGAFVSVVSSSNITIEACTADGFSEQDSGVDVTFSGNTVR